MKKALKTVLFFSIGIILFYLIYKDYNFDEILKSLTNINYMWLSVAAVLSVSAHLFRSIRWQIMMKTIGYKTGFWNSFFSVIISYFASLAIPRAGEIARCVYVNKYENIPVSTTLGSVVSERVVDSLITILGTLFAMLTAYEVFMDVVVTHAELPYSLIITAIVVALVFVLIVIIFWKKIKSLAFYKKIYDVVQGFKQGILSIVKFENKYLFTLLSIAIWASYFLCFYCITLSFDYTSELGIFNSFLIFIIATYGVIMPTPAGIGAWHAIVILLLTKLFFIDDVDAGAFALVAHGLGQVVLIIFGLISMLISPLINK